MSAQGWNELEVSPAEEPWVAACTLPTAERPLRLAEFDGLFAEALREVVRVGPTRARLVLAGGEGVEARARDLVAREGRCCSFFAFDLARTAEGLVVDVAVPPEQVAVLDGLVARAGAAR